ncbi:hypothetical protein BJ508DRAFT_363626 [Ascobolus immersus RN42]|uniref:Enhancer of mRNA-decapping protein 3 n=1 Tax=Ascobolus immersus RN42 TaxID=1160509 RepID=A0A3N4I242_ASCIM|nr:hypothetical protein BJ508DRAFT_363626 [Ascobolus immersus RN42]
MADQFINAVVLLSLKNPAHQLRGTVAAITGSYLHLSNTYNLTLGQHLPGSIVINGTDILEINIVNEPQAVKPVPSPAINRPTEHPQRPHPIPRPSQLPPPHLDPQGLPVQTAPKPQPKTETFIDPAIISFQKAPHLSKPASPAGTTGAQKQQYQQPPATPATPVSNGPSRQAGRNATKPFSQLPPPAYQMPSIAPPISAVMKPLTGSDAMLPMQKAMSQRNAVSKKGNKSAVPPPVSLAGPRVDLPGRPVMLKRHDSSSDVKKLASSINLRESSEAPRQQDNGIIGKDSRNVSPQPYNVNEDEEDDWNPSIDRSHPDVKPKRRSKPRGSRGRGPNRSRQEDLSQAEDSAKDTFATSNKIYRERYQRNGGDDGWATEDVSEFKETEFNFQANLDRFDKKSVFKQLRAEGNTANEDLLVTHNRVKKNYRHDENVLEPHMNIHPLPASNAPVLLKPTQLEESDSSDLGPSPAMARTRSRQSLTRGGSSLRGRKSLEPSFSSESELSDLENRKATKDADLHSLSQTDQVPFRQRFPSPFELVKSQSPCPALEPQQVHQLETAARETGFNPLLLTENAGRGIALAVLKYFSSRLKSSSLTPLTVVIFAGNHSPAASAIAAGRHLVSRGFKVYINIQALEQGRRLLPPVHEQIQNFKKMTDKDNQIPIKSTKFSVIAPTKNIQPDLIIDAIVNPLKGLREHNGHERRILEMMISDLMSLGAPVMSVGIPSGLSASTGRHTGDSRIAVRAEYVVAVEVPYVGLAKVMRTAGAKNGGEQGGIRHVLLVDGGMTTSAWKKAFGWNPKIGMRWGGESVWRLGLVESEEAV